MKRYKAAMILSLIYCGLGQIYKGQKLKGVCFIIGYTLLIASLALRTSYSSHIYLSVIFIIILMWVMGMIDAYIDDNDPVGVEQRFIWKRLEPILEIAVILAVLVAIAIVAYPGFDNVPVIQNPLARMIVSKMENRKISEVGSPIISTEIFSIQVAAFKDYARATELHNFIISKGYPARIDYQTKSADKLYRVLVGNFKTEKEARTFADRLNRLAGLNYIIVSRLANP